MGEGRPAVESRWDTLMPTAIQRACVLGCPQDASTCTTHGRRAQQTIDQRKVSASSKGYGVRWRAFRAWHQAECIRLHVPRAGLCGARLPSAPMTTDSTCAQHGRIVRANVLDHIVPVMGPNDPRFFDPANLQWLCDGRHGEGCHDRKRQRESIA